MKLVLLIVAGLLVVPWAVSIPQRAAHAAATEAGPVAAPDLPEALAGLYPPRAREPVYLRSMLGLSSALSGIAADVLESDQDNARAGFARLRSEYLEAAGLVPEWRDRFPLGPLELLEAALAGTDAGACLEALEALGATCHACHVDTMVPVQQAYRWKSFARISCEDGATGEALGYVKLMRDLDLAMAGIAADVAQGQRPAAQAYLDRFRKRFDQLGRTCFGCHTGKREHYVDASVREQVDQLGAALERSPIDVQRVTALLESIGDESCGRCHLVHMPAAMAQSRRSHAVR